MFFDSMTFLEEFVIDEILPISILLPGIPTSRPDLTAQAQAHSTISAHRVPLSCPAGLKKLSVKNTYGLYDLELLKHCLALETFTLPVDRTIVSFNENYLTLMERAKDSLARYIEVRHRVAKYKNSAPLKRIDLSKVTCLSGFGDDHLGKLLIEAIIKANVEIEGASEETFEYVPQGLKKHFAQCIVSLQGLPRDMKNLDWSALQNLDFVDFELKLSRGDNLPRLPKLRKANIIVSSIKGDNEGIVPMFELVQAVFRGPPMLNLEELGIAFGRNDDENEPWPDNFLIPQNLTEKLPRLKALRMQILNADQILEFPYESLFRFLTQLGQLEELLMIIKGTIRDQDLFGPGPSQSSILDIPSKEFNF
jgi:hypothetical protein